MDRTASWLQSASRTCQGAWTLSTHRSVCPTDTQRDDADPLLMSTDPGQAVLMQVQSIVRKLAITAFQSVALEGLPKARRELEKAVVRGREVKSETRRLAAIIATHKGRVDAKVKVLRQQLERAARLQLNVDKLQHKIDDFWRTDHTVSLHGRASPMRRGPVY